MLYANADSMSKPQGVVLAFDGICYQRKWYQLKPKADRKRQPTFMSGDDGDTKLKPLFIEKDNGSLVYWKPELRPAGLPGVIVADSDSGSSEGEDDDI